MPESMFQLMQDIWLPSLYIRSMEKSCERSPLCPQTLFTCKHLMVRAVVLSIKLKRKVTNLNESGKYKSFLNSAPITLATWVCMKMHMCVCFFIM